MIKKFKCGICKTEKKFVGTRHGLRKHLREEHMIKRELTNMQTAKGVFKQNWWIAEEWK